MSELVKIVPGSQAALSAADWLEHEWPGIPIIEWLRQPLQSPAEFPFVLGSQEPDTRHLQACGALLLSDMDDRPDLNPWLGCLYVEPSARRRGVARHLVRALVEHAQDVAVPRLYLFCHPTLSFFYESEGWRAIEERTYEGKPCIIMERSFCDH